MSTPFDKVVEFNYCFGTLERQAPAAEPHKQDLDQALKLVREEVNELINATTRVDKIDGVADTLVVADGMLARLGFNANNDILAANMLRLTLAELENNMAYWRPEDTPLLVNILLRIKAQALLVAHTIGADSMAAFNIVHDNNMSKICPTEEDANATIQKYAELGISTIKEPVGGRWVVRDAAGPGKGKILKNHTWAPPDLTDL